MTRAVRGPSAAALLALLASAACGGEPGAAPRVEARLALDRSEAAVGDPIGVTVEITVPAGAELGAPEPLRASAFESSGLEAWELLPPQDASARRYASRWTLRARDVGVQRLPSLEIPLRLPDAAEPDRIETGSLPIRVRSVREGLPARSAQFDIRAAPAPRPRAWPWLGAAGGAVALLAALGLRRARGARAGRAALDGVRLAREAEARVAHSLALPDARAGADALWRALLGYAAARYAIDTRALTARELPAGVAAELRELLIPVEAERYARDPDRARVADCGGRAREWLARGANA